jgi:hypothetical protein
LIFTPTTEFVRGIQPLEDIVIPKKPKKIQVDSMEIEEDIEQHENMLKQQQKKDAKRKREENPESKDERKEQDATMEDAEVREDKNTFKSGGLDPKAKDDMEEPLVSTGMAATLQLMRQKGMFFVLVGGRLFFRSVVG